MSANDIPTCFTVFFNTIQSGYGPNSFEMVFSNPHKTMPLTPITLSSFQLDSTVGEHLWNDCTNSAEVCHMGEECGVS